MNASPDMLYDRRPERTQLFLVATLTCGRTSNPVRVRNLSATGALVEGASLPPRDASITLRRGALEAVGTVAWSAGGKAGLSFDGTVNVSAWMPARSGKPPAQVDQVAFGLQHMRPVEPRAAAANTLSLGGIVEELVAIQTQLGQLGDRLATDPAVLAAHPDVQLLDVAGQRISKLIAGLKRPPA